MKISNALFITLLALSPQALAEEVVLRSANEMCVVPDRFPIEDADYSKRDAKMEKRLCSYDFHVESSTEEATAVALCPKLFSTYPAVELIELPDGSKKSDYEKKMCNKIVGGKNKGKKLAKYKNSMSCSKTPSIVGYYHVARALGIESVPVSVLRTMEKSVHQEVADRGRAATKNSPQDLIAKNWVNLSQLISSGSKSIMTDDGKHTIGGLSENPRGEQKYYEDFYPNAGGEQGVKNFRSTTLYKRLGIAKPVAQIVGTSVTTANFTGIRQMKDAADLIVLDTLFGQQDRFGNVHSIHTFMIGKDKDLKKVSLADVEDMIKEDGTATEKKQFESAMDMPSDWRKEVVARSNLLLKIVSGYFNRKAIPFAHSQEIVMKDNDCGLKGSNVFMGAKMISGVNHISEKTFTQLMRLHEKSSKGELDNYFSETLYMNSDEMNQFKKGLNYVVETLSAKCAANQLFLDLNVKDHFQGTNITTASCDVMGTPAPQPQKPPQTGGKTQDGFPIHTIVRANVSLRTLALEKEVNGATDASKYTVSGIPQLGTVGDQLAVLGTIDIGANRFAKVRVVQSQQLAKNLELYIWVKALDL